MQTIVGISVGVFLFAVAFNFLIYRFTKDISSKYISLLFFYYLIYLLIEKVFPEKYPDLFEVAFMDKDFTEKLLVIGVCYLYCISLLMVTSNYILFTNNFLIEKGGHFRIGWVKVFTSKKMILAFFISLTFLFTGLFVFIPASLPYMINFLLTFSSACPSFIFIWFLFKFLKHRTYKVSVYIFIANTIVLIGGLISFISGRILESAPDILTEFDTIASATFALMLSVSVAEKINTMRDQKEKAQADALVLLEQKVQERTEEVVGQKKLIEEKHKEITDSIHYAKRIQTALITSEKYIDKNLNKLSKD